jgi:excisionase family DNA binding protein
MLAPLEHSVTGTYQQFYQQFLWMRSFQAAGGVLSSTRLPLRLTMPSNQTQSKLHRAAKSIAGSAALYKTLTVFLHRVIPRSSVSCEFTHDLQAFTKCENGMAIASPIRVSSRQSKQEILLSVQEVARFLKINQYTVYRLVSQKKIPAFKVGNQWRFKKRMIESWLRRNMNIPPSRNH